MSCQTKYHLSILCRACDYCELFGEVIIQKFHSSSFVDICLEKVMNLLQKCHCYTGVSVFFSYCKYILKHMFPCIILPFIYDGQVAQYRESSGMHWSEALPSHLDRSYSATAYVPRLSKPLVAQKTVQHLPVQVTS